MLKISNANFAENGGEAFWMGDCSFISWLLPFYQIKLSAIYLDGLKFGMNESSDDDDEQINRVSSNIKCFVHLMMTKYNV